jgi:hypothetical protein
MAKVGVVVIGDGGDDNDGGGTNGYGGGGVVGQAKMRVEELRVEDSGLWVTIMVTVLGLRSR